MTSVANRISPLDFPLPINDHGRNADRFVLGGHTIEPLVTIDEVKDHLTILAIFQKVHDSIEEGGVILDDTTGLPIPTDLYHLHLAKIQHRFDLWISRILRDHADNSPSPPQLKDVPPTDVLMFLHSYMLNPWDFYEDCHSLYPELAQGSFPLSAVVCASRFQR